MTSVCVNYQKLGYLARDCRAPKVEPAMDDARGSRLSVKGRVYTLHGADAKDVA